MLYFRNRLMILVHVLRFKRGLSSIATLTPHSTFVATPNGGWMH